MSGTAGTWAQAVQNLSSRLARHIHRYDYFSLMRQLEAAHSTEYGILGSSNSPLREQIRVIHEPSLMFQPRHIQAVQIDGDRVIISLNGFGLFGVNAPMPLHLTEYVYERKHQYGDGSWIGFANIFQHRLAVLFYRAWANAQSVIGLDKGRYNQFDDFGRFIVSFNGLAIKKNSSEQFEETENWPSETLHPYAVRYFAGLLMPQSRSADNLRDLLNRYFNTPVQIQSNIGCWQDIPESEQTAIGKCRLPLGEGLLLGSKLYDVSTRFRIVLGPMDLKSYCSFFKQQLNFSRLRQWVEIFVGVEFEWEVQPVLAQNAIPPLKLGNGNQLGLTVWLGSVERDAADLIIQAF